MSPTGETLPGLALDSHWDLEIEERHSVLVRGAHWCVLTVESFDVPFLCDGDAFPCGSFTVPIPCPKLSQFPRAALSAGLLMLLWEEQQCPAVPRAPCPVSPCAVPAGIELITAFYGCLYSGCVPVTVRPPHAQSLVATLPTVRMIVEVSDSLGCRGDTCVTGAVAGAGLDWSQAPESRTERSSLVLQGCRS